MSEVTTSPSATCTKPLSANEIFRSLSASYNISRPILDQYLTLLVDDPVRLFWRRTFHRSALSIHSLRVRLLLLLSQMEFVGKAGESGGGMYIVSILICSRCGGFLWFCLLVTKIGCFSEPVSQTFIELWPTWPEPRWSPLFRRGEPFFKSASPVHLFILIHL